MRNARLLGLTALWLGTAAAWAQTEKPQYGGALEIVTIYPTLSALWDLADWNWKRSTTPACSTTLFAADLSVEAQGRQASVLRRRVASDAIRGEPAES
jgi:peptide/nickel transport system substrate-binding protein